MPALAAALLAVPAAAQEVAITAPALAATPSALPDEMLLPFGDLHSRMTVEVHIDSNGPWDFVVDTGAERTVVSRELAARLGLKAGPDVRVIAMTGPERVGTVTVPSLSVSQLARGAITAPALGAHDLGALGMVGIDALQDHVVAIDFDRGEMALRPAKKRRRAVDPGDVVVTAKSLYGQLIVTDARFRGKRIAVVVDTGTPMSVGNSALLQLMKARSRGSIVLTSATGRTLAADAVRVNGIEIGGIGFANVSMAIADAAPFRRFGLDGTPALLMGMDLLRLFRRVRIDFANREIRFTLPRSDTAGGVAINGV